MKKTEQIYLYFDYNIDFPKSKDLFEFFHYFIYGFDGKILSCKKRYQKMYNMRKPR